MYRSFFSSALTSHWRREVLRTNLWFVPSLEVVVAIGLFIGTLAADRAAYRGDFGLPGWVISGQRGRGPADPDHARRRADHRGRRRLLDHPGHPDPGLDPVRPADAAELHPRPRHAADPGHVRGDLRLRDARCWCSIGTGPHGRLRAAHRRSPSTLALTVADVGVLIYFIHHIAVIDPAAAGHREHRRATWPRRSENEMAARGGRAALADRARRWSCCTGSMDRGGGVVASPRTSGYLQFVRHSMLVELAAEDDAVIRLHHRPGPLRRARAPVRDRLAAPRPRRTWQRWLRRGAHHRPVPDADPGHVVRRGPAGRDRASGPCPPAVNDTFTALTCIDWLGDSLCQIADRVASGPGAPRRAGLRPADRGRTGLRPAGAAGVREDPAASRACRP